MIPESDYVVRMYLNNRAFTDDNPTDGVREMHLLAAVPTFGIEHAVRVIQALRTEYHFCAFRIAWDGVELP